MMESTWWRWSGRTIVSSIEMPETHVYRYVTAALDLAVPAGEGAHWSPTPMTRRRSYAWS